MALIPAQLDPPEAWHAPKSTIVVSRPPENRQVILGSVRAVRPWLSGQSVAVVALLLFAWAIRWPYLFSIPTFTDEMDDVLYSVATLKGFAPPLVGINTFDGAFHSRVIAAALLVTGLHWEAPRLVSWFCGGLLVGATYLLGRLYGGHRAGLIAGVLMAVSPAHILINSHVGWSNSITPLFTTMALASLAAALRWQNGMLLAGAGILGGIALQSHASTIALAPGLLIAFLALRAWRGLGPWLGIGLAMLVLMESPVIIYNLTTGFESIEYAMEHRDEVDKHSPLTLQRYVGNLGRYAEGLTQTLAGSVRDRAQAAGAISGWGILLGATLMSAGVMGLIRNRLWLLLGPCLSFTLILPLLNSQYEPTMLNARYFMPIVPLLYIGAGLLFTSLVGSLQRSPQRVLALAAAGLVVVLQLNGARSYVQSAQARGMTNDSLFELTGFLELPRGGPVLLDESLNGVHSLGGGRALKSLMVLLNLNQADYQITRPDRLAQVVPPGEQRTAILTSNTAANLRRRASDLRIRVTAVPNPEGGLLTNDQYGAYEVARESRGVADYGVCSTGTVSQWLRDGGSTRVVLDDRALTFVLDETALSNSVALRELDRVQRPRGQRLSVCPRGQTSFDSNAVITIREPQELIFHALN